MGNSKITYVIADNKSNELISIIKNTITNVQYVQSFENIEQVIKPDLIISEDKLTYNNNSGLKIKRMRKKFLILCKNANLNNKFIEDIKNIYGKIFDIYIETIDEIYTYIAKGNTDTFAFRNLIFELFKSYTDVDYLIII